MTQLSVGKTGLLMLVATAAFAALVSSPNAHAQGLNYAATSTSPTGIPGMDGGSYGTTDDSTAGGNESDGLPQRLQRKIVSYTTHEAAGTIVIDTSNTVLYYVLGNGRAIRYGVGVGREGFTWSGTQTISRKAEWPDWHPPSDMIARQPYLPRFMAGGPGNPLGARAMYLGSSVYRIHGTNDPSTIGKFVSSGCIRLTNSDVEDLFSRASVGTRVVVLPKSASSASRIEANSSTSRYSASSSSTLRTSAATAMPQTLQHQAVNTSGSGLY